MKKKQKINKVVNCGEWVLLGLTALFLCFLFAVRDRPAPERGLTVRTAAQRPPDSVPAPAPVDPDGVPVPAPVEADGVPASAPVEPDSVPVPARVEADGGAAARVNINTADLSELCALPGIGESLAGRVIAYRE
ncbi:MAG: helix-hairpin-helix domain-containing protein, partial [Oscillibacter sp.]|nr:helix-hairpin-helix domain-containing protein [Oscillibacter sp.]